MVQKIISGGQTGVDIAALRAAKRCGIATGGYMPKGYRTEDGNKPEYAALYGMVELPARDYPPRTRANAQAADLTIIIGHNLLSRGCRLTRTQVVYARKALANLDISAGATFDLADAKKRSHLVDFIAMHLFEDYVRIVNFAGNRDVDEAVMEDIIANAIQQTIDRAGQWLVEAGARLSEEMR